MHSSVYAQSAPYPLCLSSDLSLLREGAAYVANLRCFSELAAGLWLSYALGGVSSRAEHSKHEFRVRDSLCRLFCRVCL